MRPVVRPIPLFHRATCYFGAAGRPPNDYRPGWGEDRDASGSSLCVRAVAGTPGSIVTSGRFDPTFGTGGQALVPLPASPSVNTASVAPTILTLLDGWAILEVNLGDAYSASYGYRNNPAELTIDIVRVTSTEQLDASFGSGGVAEVDFPDAVAGTTIQDLFASIAATGLALTPGGHGQLRQVDRRRPRREQLLDRLAVAPGRALDQQHRRWRLRPRQPQITGDDEGDGRTDLAIDVLPLATFADHPSGGGGDVVEPFGTGGVDVVPASTPPTPTQGEAVTSLAVPLPIDPDAAPAPTRKAPTA